MRRPLLTSGFHCAGKLALAILFALAVTASTLRAQTVSLTLANNAITFAAPTAADYNAGWINSGSGVTFTVNETATGGGTVTTKIVVRSTSANLGGGKVIGDLQWRRSDLSTWNAITTTDVTVESRTVTFNGTNDPWSNTIFFRLLLDWTKDAPATYTATYRITLTVTQP